MVRPSGEKATDATPRTGHRRVCPARDGWPHPRVSPRPLTTRPSSPVDDGQRAAVGREPDGGDRHRPSRERPQEPAAERRPRGGRSRPGLPRRRAGSRARRPSTHGAGVPSECGDHLVGTGVEEADLAVRRSRRRSSVPSGAAASARRLGPWPCGVMGRAGRDVPAGDARGRRPRGAIGRRARTPGRVASPGYARQADGEKTGAAGSQRRTEPSKPPVAICRAVGAKARAETPSPCPWREARSRPVFGLPELDGRVEAAGGEHPASGRERQAGNHVRVPRQRATARGPRPASQSLTSPSSPPVASVAPSGENAGADRPLVAVEPGTDRAGRPGPRS